jgi:hypothetical protein
MSHLVNSGDPATVSAMWSTKARTRPGTCPPPRDSVNHFKIARIIFFEERNELTRFNCIGHVKDAQPCLLRNMKVSATVHGMRSSFRDWAGDKTSFQREHVEACLAHRVGNSVELAYRRLDAQEKRREILEAWSAYCA